MRKLVTVLALVALTACLLTNAQAATTQSWATSKQDYLASQCTKDIDSCTMRYQTSPSGCESEYEYSDCLRKISNCVSDNYYHLQSIQRAVDDGIKGCIALAKSASLVPMSALFIFPFFSLLIQFVL